MCQECPEPFPAYAREAGVTMILEIVDAAGNAHRVAEFGAPLNRSQRDPLRLRARVMHLGWERLVSEDPIDPYARPPSEEGPSSPPPQERRGHD